MIATHKKPRIWKVTIATLMAINVWVNGDYWLCVFLLCDFTWAIYMGKCDYGYCMGKMVIFFWGLFRFQTNPMLKCFDQGRASVEACWHAMAAVNGNISTWWHALHHQTFNVQAPLGFQSWNIEIGRFMHILNRLLSVFLL